MHRNHTKTLYTLRILVHVFLLRDHLCMHVANIHLFPGQAKLMATPADMQDADSDGDMNGEIRPQIGSVGFVISSRSLCVYTPLGWIDVKVRTYNIAPHSVYICMYIHIYQT